MRLSRRAMLERSLIRPKSRGTSGGNSKRAGIFGGRHENLRREIVKMQEFHRASSAYTVRKRTRGRIASAIAWNVREGAGRARLLRKKGEGTGREGAEIKGKRVDIRETRQRRLLLVQSYLNSGSDGTLCYLETLITPYTVANTRPRELRSKRRDATRSRRFNYFLRTAATKCTLLNRNIFYQMQCSL